MKDYVRNDERYRQYRRTDYVYERALDKMNFETPALTTEGRQAIKQAIWHERDVLSLKEDIDKLGNYEHKIPTKEKFIIRLSEKAAI